jgi:flagellar biosynthesis/type III secretory pathway M-ring protein FliF/YscJ
MSIHKLFARLRPVSARAKLVVLYGSAAILALGLSSVVVAGARAQGDASKGTWLANKGPANEAPAPDGGARGAEDLASTAAQDRELAARVNQSLEIALGPRKALATVVSEWDHDTRTTVAETIDPKGVLVSQEKTSTRAPQASAKSAEEPAALASEEKKTFATGKTVTQTVHATPVLVRRCVSLMLDEGLSAQKDELSQFVKNAVGFVEGRDSFSASTTAFSVGPDASSRPGAADSDPPRSSAATFIWRFVEVLGAAVALVLIWRAWGSLRLRRLRAGAPPVPTAEEAALDAELAARRQVEELVQADPQRVGEILSRWAGEDRLARSAR